MRLRMYQVGFGDCFLLTVRYAGQLATGRNESHVLIDCGSTSLGEHVPRLHQTANQIAADCGGHLDALVITHRHKDHLGAFGDSRAGPILRALRPDLVVRPWTENPRRGANSGKKAGFLLNRLAAGQQLALTVVEKAQQEQRGLRSSLVLMASDALPNAEAIDVLNELSRGKRGEYLWAGELTQLERVVPDTRVTVIGPPKPTQWPQVIKQAYDSDEYWLGLAPDAQRQIVRRRAPKVGAGPRRWILNRVVDDDRDELLSLVRWLDQALNNTSLILLWRIGQHTLLLGGDAQIENWGWALKKADDDPSFAKLLSSIDLYKVGHHGSRNGTPISLYERWAARRVAGRLSVVSTKASVHGEDDGAVPKRSLLAALRGLGKVVSSEGAPEAYLDVEADLPDGGYTVVKGRRSP